MINDLPRPNQKPSSSMPSPMLSEVSDRSLLFQPAQPVLQRRTPCVGLDSARVRETPWSYSSHTAQYRLPEPVPPTLSFFGEKFNYETVPLPQFNSVSALVPTPRRSIDCSSFEKSVNAAHNGIRHLASLKAHHANRKGLQDVSPIDMESDAKMEDTSYQMVSREATMEARRMELHMASMELKGKILRTSDVHIASQGHLFSTMQQQQQTRTFAEASVCLKKSLEETSGHRNHAKREWTQKITAALSPRLNEKVADTPAFVQRRWAALQTSSFAAPHD